MKIPNHSLKVFVVFSLVVTALMILKGEEDSSDNPLEVYSALQQVERNLQRADSVDEAKLILAGFAAVVQEAQATGLFTQERISQFWFEYYYSASLVMAASDDAVGAREQLELATHYFKLCKTTYDYEQLPERHLREIMFSFYYGGRGMIMPSWFYGDSEPTS